MLGVAQEKDGGTEPAGCTVPRDPHQSLSDGDGWAGYLLRGMPLLPRQLCWREWGVVP